MSSYKTHALAGIIMALPFVPSFFYIFFALIGASIPDMDHKHNKNKVHSMFLIGIIISLLLFIFKGSILSGIIIVFLAILFYFSQHRGFTHSLVGVLVICLLFLFMMMGFIPVVLNISAYVNYAMPNTLLIFILLALLGYFVVSRKVLSYYLIVLASSLFIAPVNIVSINWLMVLLMLFIGSISHIVLDLLTPSGLTVFWPLNNEKYYKNLALIFIGIWLICSVIYIVNYGFWLEYLIV